MLIPKTETDNVGMICPDCADRRKADLNATAYELAYYVGKFCKLAFPVASTVVAGSARQAKANKEHMWVKVIMLGDAGDKELLGTLANDPVYATQWAYGDVIDFNRGEIEQVQP